MEITPKLLKAAKSHLHITWSDEGTEERLTNSLSRGISRINDSTGKEWDFDKTERPQELLLEYARYDQSSALDEWENSYLSEIYFLKHKAEIAGVNKDDTKQAP